jgi:hypothetical protein
MRVMFLFGAFLFMCKVLVHVQVPIGTTTMAFKVALLIAFSISVTEHEVAYEVVCGSVLTGGSVGVTGTVGTVGVITTGGGVVVVGGVGIVVTIVPLSSVYICCTSDDERTLL